MRKSPLLLFFSFALLLAACGGGSGGGTPATAPPTATPIHTSTPAPAATQTATPVPTPTPTPAPSPLHGAGLPLAGPTQASNGGWLPAGVAQALNFPVQQGWDGTGQTIAVVIDSNVLQTDLNAFFAAAGITRTGTITTVAVSPLPAPTINPNAQDEATLDVETVAGLAPGANVIIYEIQDLSDPSITNGYNQVVSDGKAFVVNSSFGGCEGPPFTPPAEDTVIASGAAKGIAWLASAGDNGNSCDGTAVGAGWPASNPHVMGVGGTETDSSRGFDLTSNKVWNDKSCSGNSQCAGGGGVSQLYTLPAYQSTAGLLTVCESPGFGAPCSGTMRNTPDFSLPAEFVAIFEKGAWGALNGTSWSSPEAAALFSELYQYCGASGGAIPGVAEPAGIPYYVFGKSPADFIDVNWGNNQWATTTPFYTADPGYDDAGGLGVPFGSAFIQTACPNRAPAAGLSRTRMALSSAMYQTSHAGAYTVDVTPRVRDITDEGQRGAAEPTAIQVVIQPQDAASNEAAVISALQSAGFTIAQTFPNHLVVNATAPSATVEQFFRTRIHNVWQSRYGARYMPATQIVVPASIAPYAFRVTLDNVITHHPLLSVR